METLRPGIREAHRIPHTPHQLPSDLAGTARPPPENLLAPLGRSRPGPKPEKLLPRPGDRASFLRTPKPATSFFTPAVLQRNSILVPRRRVPTSAVAATLGTTHGPN